MYLNEFNELAKKVGNRYEAVNLIVQRSRKLSKECKEELLDSQALTWAISGKKPKLKRPVNISREYSRLTEVLSNVSDEDVISSVLSSVRNSTKDSIHYVYMDSLSESQMKRVQVLTKMILLT